MATVNARCNEIIDKVNTSGLDYHINLTPYSIHLSIRKKFSRNSSTALRSPSSTTPAEDFSQSDLLRQELLNTRNEYAKLFNFYNLEMERTAKLKLELFNENEMKNKVAAELAEALAKLNVKEENKNTSKHLKLENKKLQETCENKSLELKHLKLEIENLKKDKNGLSVALKGSRQELKEHVKAFAKEKNVLETKICELSEFKSKKLSEEREEKSRKRKEIKKANRKKKGVNSLEDNRNSKDFEQEAADLDKIESVDEGDNIDENFNCEVEPCESARVMRDKATNNNFDDSVDIQAKEADEILCKKDEVGEETSDVSEESRSHTGELVDESDESFIGPKLPRMMTKEEVEAFKAELFAKYF